MDLVEARRYLGVTVSKTEYAARTRRKLPFTITIDYVMKLLKEQNGKCALTGWNLQFTRGGDFGYGTNPMGCTMDRIDNNKGYVPGNVQLVCWMPNKIKGELHDYEFKNLCESVVNHAKRIA